MKRPGVREVMEVRDNLAAIGRHACPGFDCAVCQSSHNVEALDDALAAINASTPGELLLRRSRSPDRPPNHPIAAPAPRRQPGDHKTKGTKPWTL